MTSLALGLPGRTSGPARASVTQVVALLEGLSAGSLEVGIVDDPDVCEDAAGCVPALRDGRLDIAPVTTSELVTLFPELEVLHLPYLFESGAVVERVLDGPFATRLFDGVQSRTGLRTLAVTVRDWRGYATSGRIIHAPEDLEGLRIWTGGSSVEASLVTALRARPMTHVLSPGSKAFGVDGGVIALTDLVARGLHPQLGFFTLDRHSVVLTWWLVNEARHRGLSARDQPVVQAGFDEMRRQQRGAAEGLLAEARRVYESAGGRLHVTSPAERMALLLATGRVALEYMDEHGPDWLVWLEAAIAQAEAEIAQAGDGADVPLR